MKEDYIYDFESLIPQFESRKCTNHNGRVSFRTSDNGIVISCRCCQEFRDLIEKEFIDACREQVLKNSVEYFKNQLKKTTSD
ncbi:hypothetical protein [Paenimyroides ceti]